MSKRFQKHYSGPGIAQVPGVGIVFDAGTTVPTSATAGYAKGCIFIETDASTGILTQYINTGTSTSCTFTQHLIGLQSAQGFIPLDLASFRAIASNDIPALAGTPASGILAADTAPKLLRVNAATDKAIRISWAASSQIEIANWFNYPPDMDVTTTYTVNLRAKSSSTNDTPVIAIGVFEGIGDTNRGGNTAALSSSTATVSVTVTPTAGAPNFAAISLIPGTHGTDTVELYAAWITYTKKLLTS